MTTERAVHLRIEGHGAVNGEVTGRLAEGGTGRLGSVIGVEEVPAEGPCGSHCAWGQEAR